MDFYQVPVGFGMALARNPVAMNTYCAMTQEQQQSVLNRARSAQSEREMYQIVDNLAGKRVY